MTEPPAASLATEAARAVRQGVLEKIGMGREGCRRDLPLEAGVMTQVVRANRDDLTRLDSELGQGHGFFRHPLLGVLHVEVVGIVRIAKKHRLKTEPLRLRQRRGGWQLGDVLQPAVGHDEPNGELRGPAGLPGP